MDRDAARPTLTAVEQRVLGALLEKERTVPASYPMTLNGLRTACNQSSGRDPDPVDSTKPTWPPRSTTSRHAATSAWSTPATAPGWSSTARCSTSASSLERRRAGGPHPPAAPRCPDPRRAPSPAPSGCTASASSETWRPCLAGLAGRPEPLVEEQERRPGQKERRWIHLLGPVATSPSARRAPGSAAPPADPTVTEGVLADGPLDRDAQVVATYDEVATDLRRPGRSTSSTPSPSTAGSSSGWSTWPTAGRWPTPGCGPGHVAFHLAAAGAEVTGFDLSPGMVDRGPPPVPRAAPSRWPTSPRCPAPASARTDGGLGGDRRLVLAGAPGRVRAGAPPWPCWPPPSGPAATSPSRSTSAPSSAA